MATRKNNSRGDGNIRQLKSGNWHAQVMVGRDADGKRIYKYFTAKTKSEVKMMIREFWANKAQNDTVEPILFETLSEEWFEQRVKKISKRTADGYQYTLKKINEHFGKWNIGAIKAADIEKFLDKIEESGLSASYRAKCRSMLNQILKRGVANDLIPKNPVEFAEKAKKREIPKEKETFNAGEVKHLMVELSTDRIGISIRIMLATGLRTQELLALTKRQIATDGSTIVIDQATTMDKGKVLIGMPKSFSGYRVVPVPSALRGLVLQLRAEIANSLLWESPKNAGRPINPSTFRKYYNKALEQMEMRILTPHCCRHTYVSQMQALGVPIETIRGIVGHADTDMTQHYLHVQKEVKEAAAEKFSDYFCA